LRKPLGSSSGSSQPFPQRGSIGAEEYAAVGALFERAIREGSAPGYNGEEETRYCEEFAAFMGGGYTDAVSSGTAGLYVALKALDLEPFSEVIVGAVTDPGGMMPIPLLNLIPMVADTAPESYNTGPEQVEALISPRTAAIVVPHIGGEPADVEGIMAVAGKYHVPVIEDCSQTHGATLHGRLVGTFGQIGVFSTMFSKHHSSGGQGGLVYTRDESLHHAIRRASDRGKPFFLPDGSTNVTASLNLNLNDLAAAIGRVQLRKLPEQVRRRRRLVGQLSEGIASLKTVSIPRPLAGAEPSFLFLRMRFHADQAAAGGPMVADEYTGAEIPRCARNDSGSPIPHCARNDSGSPIPHCARNDSGLPIPRCARNDRGPSAYTWGDKETYCQALSAEGLPVGADYRYALPHTMDWFVNRRVFGHSGYPWASPDYKGDPQLQFPCPNAHAAMEHYFNLYLHERWGQDEIADAIAIFTKVERMGTAMALGQQESEHDR
jgi:dTDP-4-amino-4,6-dideoxygalactose transaminase